MQTQYSQYSPTKLSESTDRSLFSSLWKGFKRAISGDEIHQLQMEKRNLEIAVQTAVNGAPITPPEVEQHIDFATTAVREAQHRQQRWQEDQNRLQQQSQVPRQEVRQGNGNGYQERQQSASHLTMTETQQREQREQKEREQREGQRAQG